MINIELQKFILISSSLIPLFISIILIRNSFQNKEGNWTLAIFLILFSLSPAIEYLRLSNLLHAYWMIYYEEFSLFLYGPFSLFFIQHCLKKTPKLLPSIAHLSPFTLLFCLSVLEINTSYYWFLNISTAVILIYLTNNIRLLFNHRRQVASIHGAYRNSAYFWLVLVVYSLALLTILKLFVLREHLIAYAPSDLKWQYSEYILCFNLVVIASFSVWRPEIFYHRKKTTISSAQQPPLKRVFELGEDVGASLYQQLQLTMEQEKLYLQDNLSLTLVANHLSISTHQLSELLNVYLNKNFYQYLNEWRINAAIELLERPDCRLAIIDIAYSSGFNNKSSFYRCFKERVNLTPSEYRQKIAAKR